METKGIQKLGNLLSKNSPVILTGIGVAGLIATTVMAVKATPKAMQIIKNEYYAEDSDIEVAMKVLTKREIVRLTWKCYLPAVIMGGVTIGCIIGANSINLRRNAALASVYSLSEAALKEYQSKVIETIGENKEHKIKDEIAKDRITKHQVNDSEVIITNYGDTLCYDSLSGRYFKSDVEHIRSAFNTVSYDMMSEMFISLNQLYSELGLRGTELGDLLGWHIDSGKLEPDFSSQLTDDGRPCLVVNYNIMPRYTYSD